MSSPVVSELIERSNRLGADPRNTNYAGGNLSHPVDRLLLLDARLRSTVASTVLAAVQRLFLPAEADPPTGTFVLPGRT